MKITRADYEYWKLKKQPALPSFFKDVSKIAQSRTGRDLIDGAINARSGYKLSSEPHNTMEIIRLRRKRMTDREAIFNDWHDREPKRLAYLDRIRRKMGEAT